MENIRIATAVVSPLGRSPEENLSAIHRLSRSASAGGARVICFPEMSITGYDHTPEVKKRAETVPGPSSRAVAEMAAAEGIVIICGLAEKDAAGFLYISQMVAVPGEPVGVYRKLHIPPPEQAMFRRGNELPVFEIPGLRFGIQLCYDSHFPDISTILAARGADLIFIPHASPRGGPEEKFHSWMRHLPARAFDNGLFIAACNISGKNGRGVRYPGISLVLNPSGHLENRSLEDGEHLLFTDLRKKEQERIRRHRMRYFLPGRRPSLYRRLAGESRKQ